MRSEELKKRSKKFSLEVIELVKNLPGNSVANVLGKQVLRSATSIGANYRAACRARSKAEFIAKLGIVEEESDETTYWLELLTEAKLINETKAKHLIKEAEEITAIVVSSIKTAKKNK